ncbi:hypothetical protein FJ366_02670 [Candidatus Dependentiae bacterium]|nr:hypothetical protein [Candidatus Dependentiae bacterium]
MNKKLMIIAVFALAGSVSAWPGWMCSSKKSVDAVKPHARLQRRPSSSDGGVRVETVTRKNPYHVTREKFEEAPSELRESAREARRGGRQFERVHGQAKKQHSSDFARTHGDIRRDAGRIMMRTRGEAKMAFDGAAVLDERADQARDLRKEARKRFNREDKRMQAWAAGEDENPTAL